MARKKHRAEDSVWQVEPGQLAYECVLCGNKFQMSKGVYRGKFVPQWNTQICEVCCKANWDGIVPGAYPRFEKHVRDNGISLKLNGKGWIDIP